MKFVENYYGTVFKMLLRIINPFKKIIIKTEAKVHQFINIQAINILCEHGYSREYKILNKYISQLNKGVIWADQDFKSINHFYNPIKEKGLYGHSNALLLTQKYYENAVKYWEKSNIEKSMFYLGACVHIIQDLTIPQHVNVRLLDNHRQYENFVKMTYDVVNEFSTLKSPIIFNDLEKYVRFNSKVALRVYKQFKYIKKDKIRFHKITNCALPLAQRTTAGCLLMFLNEVKL